MHISSKISLSVTGIAVILWGALYGLFYFNSGDSGLYPEIAIGEVKGVAVKRFQLPKDEILITSRRAVGIDTEDVLLITESEKQSSQVVYIVRGNDSLVFEQRISENYDNVEWNQDENSFIISSNSSKEALWITLSGDTYSLQPGE
jgi:hypothetical protein